MEPLPLHFFLQPTVDAARALLGQWVVRRGEDGRLLRLRVVETEAYTVGDPACHAFRGRTRANAAMFGAPGTAYVHINYGIHHCLNAVTQPDGIPEAVLIRALEPWPGDAAPERTLWAGPGRLARSLEIRKERFDGAPLRDPDAPLFLAVGDPPPSERIVVATRIGITKGADLPWRFYDAGSPLVSRR